MNAVDPNLRPGIATRLLAGISVPDTPLISRAIEYAREHSEPYLFNHVMRSWLFAVILAQLSDSVHDAEVLAVTTILHDLGLAKAFDGPLRFERLWPRLLTMLYVAIVFGSPRLIGRPLLFQRRHGRRGTAPPAGDD